MPADAPVRIGSVVMLAVEARVPGDRLIESILREIAVATYACAFAFIAARALLDWHRRRDHPTLWFASAFAALAAVVLTSAVFQLFDSEPSTYVMRGLIVLLALYSPCLLAFAASFAPVTETERVAAAVVFTVLAAWAAFAFEPAPPDGAGSSATVAFSIVFSTAWLVTSIRVVICLWTSTHRRPAVVRGRMKLLATGFALLDVVLVMQLLDTDRSFDLAIAVLAALAAIVVLLGGVPPRWLRALLRERELRALREAIAGIATARTEDEVLDALLPTARSALGVERVAFIAFDDGDVLASGFDEHEIDRIRTIVSELDPAEVGRSVVIDGWHVTHGGASWIVVERSTRGAFLGEDEYEVLSSVDAIMRLSIARIRDATAILESREHLRTAVDIAGIGKWRWTVGEDTVWWSPRMYELYGVPHAESASYERYASTLAADERVRMAEVLANTVEHGGSYDVEHRIIRRDGGEAWIQSRGRAVSDADGEIRTIMGVSLDVTERVRNEQELRDAVETEREAARRLRELDELKSSILSAVSHELRTPLTAVHGLAILLQDRIDELDDDQRHEVVHHLVAETERLAQLFADLLDVDRLRRGGVAADRSDVNVRELVQAVTSTHDHAGGIFVDVPDLAFPLDGPKYERIVENLVTNAEKYAGPGSPIRISARIDADELELVVEDSGPGVPESLRDEIFEPFNRGDAKLGHAPGTGIGLSLVRQFARIHEGRVWVEDADAGGARFVVRVPDGASSPR